MRGSGRALPGYLRGYHLGYHDGAAGVMRSFGAEYYFARTSEVGPLGPSQERIVGLVLPGPSICTPQSHPRCHDHCRECWQQGYEAGIARMRKASAPA